MKQSETGWLIEMKPGGEWMQGGPRYWSGYDSTSFTSDPNEAVRFARREDAERVREGIVLATNECMVTEHEWVPPMHGEATCG